MSTLSYRRAAAFISVLLTCFTSSSAKMSPDGAVCRNRSFLSSTPIAGRPSEVVVVGSIAYVLIQYSGIQTYDVQDPSSPVLLGTYQTPGTASDFVVKDNHVFIADGYDHELHIVDVTDPATPTHAASYFVPEGVVGRVAISGSTLCLATNGASTGSPQRHYFFDVSDPASPVLIRGIGRSGRTADMHMTGDLLYVLEDRPYPNYDRINIYDIGDPASPSQLSSTTVNGQRYLYGLDLVGDYVYTRVNFGDGVAVIDVSDPSDPSVVNVLAIENIYGTHLHEGHLYQIGESGLKIAYADDLVTPIFHRAVDSPYPVFSIDVQGDLAFILTSFGLHAIDISDRSEQPSTVIGSAQLDDPRSIELVESTAYIASGESGLLLVDVGQPSDPVVLGRLDTPGYAYKTAVGNGVAYLADGGGGLHIVDISDQVNPTLLNTLETGGEILDLGLDDNILYLADGSTGLHVFDVQNPLDPHPVGENLSLGGIYKIAVSNGVVVIGASNGRAYALNATDPASITIGWDRYIPYLTEIAIIGSHAILLRDNDGAQEGFLLGIADPSNFEFIESRYVPVTYLASDGLGQCISVSDTDRHLHVLDQDNLFAPLPVGWAYLHGDSSARAKDVAISGSAAYVIDESGLRIVDMSDCPPCLADYDLNGVLDATDASAFLNAYYAQDPMADLNQDALFNFFDISEFLTSFLSGCP